MISGLFHLKDRSGFPGCSTYADNYSSYSISLQFTNPDPMFLATWKLLALTVNPVKYQVGVLT